MSLDTPLASYLNTKEGGETVRFEGCVFFPVLTTIQMESISGSF